MFLRRTLPLVKPTKSYDVRPARLPLSERIANESSSYILQHAINVAKESFLEIEDVERERIRLEAH
jgi:hypothetical protein